MTAKNELTTEEIRYLVKVVNALEKPLTDLIDDMTLELIDFNEWKRLSIIFQFRVTSMKTYGFGINADGIEALANIVDVMRKILKEFKLVIKHVELRDWDRGLLRVMADLENPFPEINHPITMKDK